MVDQRGFLGSNKQAGVLVYPKNGQTLGLPRPESGAVGTLGFEPPRIKNKKTRINLVELWWTNGGSNPGPFD